jgi:hypothetical protein
MPDISIETGGQLLEMRLLPLFAGHAIGLAIDLYGYLSHAECPDCGKARG